MRKKNYIKPNLFVYAVNLMHLLQDSTEIHQGSGNGDLESKPTGGMNIDWDAGLDDD